MRVNGDVFVAGTGTGTGAWLASTTQFLEEVVNAGLVGPDRRGLGYVHRDGGQSEVHDVLGFTGEQTLWRQFGRYVGHLGGGDQIAGLDYLVQHDELEPGDRVTLFAVGTGFTFSAAVLEITRRSTC